MSPPLLLRRTSCSRRATSASLPIYKRQVQLPRLPLPSPVPVLRTCSYVGREGRRRRDDLRKVGATKVTFSLCQLCHQLAGTGPLCFFIGLTQVETFRLLFDLLLGVTVSVVSQGSPALLFLAWFQVVNRTPQFFPSLREGDLLAAPQNALG